MAVAVSFLWLYENETHDEIKVALKTLISNYIFHNEFLGKSKYLASGCISKKDLL